jgi:hypothetical protein
MQQFKAQGWHEETFPMRMSAGSIVQMNQYNDHHFVYYDSVDNDEWEKPTKFPFLIDWWMDDNGKFLTFTKEQIEQEHAIGVQRLTNPKHRSITNCSMFD